jgi:hypothetical protein
VPAEHIVHVSAPAVEYVPPAQSWHEAAPNPAYVPAEHDDPHSDEPALLNLPAAQFSQASWLGVVFLPLSHWEQDAEPLLLA